jgi:hypothetical protein
MRIKSGANMTPADRRISELIDKWLVSIDLHLQYVELSDAAYARAQPWPKHDRPTRWVLEVAKQKVLELKGHVETRQAMGDSKFSESLELMAFLANLVGIQHIQRFVPLADPNKTEAASTTQTIEAPTVVRTAPHRVRATGDDTTREMPRLKAAAPVGGAAPKAAPPKPRVEEPKPAHKAPQTAKLNIASAAKAPASKAAGSLNADLREKIIADAVRLLKWGKPWHELAELIARIADRPAEGEIRKVLRAQRADIEKKAQAK